MPSELDSSLESCQTASNSHLSVVCFSAEGSSASSLSVAVSTPSQEVHPPKAKKPRGLELPSSPSILPPGLSLDKVNAAVNSLLAPGSATNTLTPTVITSHALVSDSPHPLACNIVFCHREHPLLSQLDSQCVHQPVCTSTL